MKITSTDLYLQGGYLAVAIMAVVIIFLTIVVSQIFLMLLNRAYAKRGAGERPGSIFVILIRAIVWAIGIGLLLKVCLGFDVTIIWGALGVGGIALSLGLQSTISNLLGGLFVSFSKEVKVGDWIQVGTVSGTVTDINWRSARLLDDQGRTHTVPNAVLNTTTVTRYPDFFRVAMPLVLSRDADTDELTPILCTMADEALDAKGMRYGEMPASLACTGLTAEGVQATIVVFATWDFTSAQVNDTVLPPIVRYLQANNLYGRWS